jgi:hypothetical protein
MSQLLQYVSRLGRAQVEESVGQVLGIEQQTIGPLVPARLYQPGGVVHAAQHRLAGRPGEEAFAVDLNRFKIHLGLWRRCRNNVRNVLSSNVGAGIAMVYTWVDHRP